MGIIATQIQEQYTNIPIDTLIHGDALEVLKTLPDNFVHAIVADPPAGINFMNKEFDHNKGGRTQWVAWLSEIMREARRVLKPGGHALVWSLPRTSHWTALALEDAGFEIRDCLYNLVSGDTTLHNFIQSLSDEQQHAFMQIIDEQREPSGVLNIFGSGFPKSHDISKAIDRHFKAEREIIGIREDIKGGPGTAIGSLQKSWLEHEGRKYAKGLSHDNNMKEHGGIPITAPSSEAAKQFDGYGSALKPAVENWILVRKPLAAKSIAENVLEYGTGGLNIDGCRVGNEITEAGREGRGNNSGYAGGIIQPIATPQHVGRFPSHLLLSHTLFCYESGTKRVRPGNGSGVASKGDEPLTNNVYGEYKYRSLTKHVDEDGMETVTNWICDDQCPVRILDEQGGLRKTHGGGTFHEANLNKDAIQFSSTYRTPGTFKNDQGYVSRYFQQFPALDDVPPYIYAGKASRKDRTANNTVNNTHPTVKNIELMKYMCRMICPPNGIVLDMFAGSGSTGVACIQEGLHFILIEKEQEYVEIAKKRIAHAKEVDRWE